MDRVLQNTPAVISASFYEDGTLVDPGAVTIGITRADGTTLVAAGTATSGSGAAARTYTLTITHTALLDRLTATWTSSTKGTVTTTVEVVGGFLFSIADARADTDLTNTSTYPTAKIIEARTYAEQELERACGVAFVPRYEYATFYNTGTGLILPPRVRSIRTISVGDTALTSSEIADLNLDPSGVVYRATSWNGATVVGYEHGYDYPPAAVSQAALILAKDYLVRGPMDDRAIQRATEDGPVFIATPGWRGARFGIPAVDAVVDAYGFKSVGV